MVKNNIRSLTAIQKEILELLSKGKIISINKYNLGAIGERSVAPNTTWFLTKNKLVTRKDKSKSIITKGNGYIISEKGKQVLELCNSRKKRANPRILISEKKCRRCKNVMPISVFVDSSGYKNPRGRYCPQCHIDEEYEILERVMEGRDFCLYCGSKIIKVSDSLEGPLTSWATIHLDHMDPISLGGKDNETNTVNCCSICNRKKGNKLFVEWLKCLDNECRTLSRNVYIQKHGKNPEDFKPRSNKLIISFSIDQKLINETINKIYKESNLISNMKLQFLSMQNCPNVSPMWDSLQSAMKELQLNQPIEQLDLNTLSEKQDKRAGYGSPTILINGKDLFDSPFPETYNPSCRYYSNGLPDANEIVTKLKIISNK